MEQKIRSMVLLTTLLWAAFTAITIQAMIALSVNAEPGMGFLRHVSYGLQYGNMRLLRNGIVCGGSLLVSWLWRKCAFNDRSFHLSALLLAFFFSWNTVMWLSSQRPRLLEHLLFLPGTAAVENLLFYLQLTVNYYCMIAALCDWLNHRDALEPLKISKTVGLLYGAIIVLGWLPILFLRSPGSLYMDTVIQILMYQGSFPIHASMPVLLNYLYGGLFALGQHFEGDNGGIFVCAMLQICLLLSAMTVACREAALVTGRKSVGLVLSHFFALVPVYPEMALGLIKDSIHGAVYLFFLIFFIRVLQIGKRADFFGLAIWGVLAVATRKGGVYLVAICLVGLAIKQKAWRKMFLLGTAALLLGSWSMNSLVYPALGIDKPWKRENYSLIYPVTAYYCQMHGQELTPEEVQIIDDVLDYDTVCKMYSNIVVDDVKNTFHASNDAQIRKYLLLNAKFLIRHPATCLEAVVYSKNLYYTPFSLGGQTMYVTQCPLDAVEGGRKSDFSFWMPEDARLEGEDRLEMVQNFLPVRILCSPGLYSCVVGILLLAAIWDKRTYFCWMLLPVATLTVGLLLTHINGAVRYAFPQMVCVPFLTAIYTQKKK